MLAISERTKRDLVELYRVPSEKVVVTPLGVDPIFHPSTDGAHAYALFVGASRSGRTARALGDAAAAGLPLVAVGPEKDAALAAELRRRGADVRGYVPKGLAMLYAHAACVILPSRYEGFGLPVVEAMASTPVV